MSSLQQNWRRGQNTFCLKEKGVGGKGQRKGQGQEGEIGQIMYAHTNK
jgi:hypothetical protein